MRILFFGDSITDANRNRETDFSLGSYGLGYVRSVAGALISENPDSVTDFRNGHDRAIKYLMGQVMKKSQGKADPRSAMELLNSELEKLK